MTDATQPWLQWIGEETVSKLYAEGIKRWGGSGSLPKSGCINGALGAALMRNFTLLKAKLKATFPG